MTTSLTIFRSVIQNLTKATLLFVFFILLIFNSNVYAQAISMTNSPLTYTQAFNTLNSTGTITWADNSTISGWYAQRTGTGTTLSASTGSSTGGDLYSLGSTSSSERALGSLGSGNAAAGSFAWGTIFQNNTTATIASISVGYTGEQWRNNGNATAQTVTFWYKVSSTLVTSLNPGSVNTGWTAVNALDFTSPIATASAATLDGNLSANKITFLPTSLGAISIPVGHYLILRWSDIDHPGNDHVMGIDDFNITWPAGGGTSLPTVSTSAISSITQNSAVSGGNVTSDGGDPVTVRGVVYATAPNPTLANSFTTDGAGTGVYVSSLSTLTENTLYYVKAYATNSIGTSYGGQQTFTTLKSAPLTQAFNIVLNGGGTSMDVSWTNGSGDRRIVKMNTSNTFSDPTNGTDPVGNSTYSGGEQVMYNGSGNALTVFGLTPATNYWFRVYSYNNTGASTLYNITTAANNPMMGNSGVFTCPTDLIISEYVEGSSNNKYIEIYNGTASDINLSNYELRLYSNGGTTPSASSMTGILPAGQTIVYKNSSAAVYLGAATTSGATNFNGDDAFAIWHIPSASFVDIFGTIGQDPGAAWTSASNSTQDKTLRRKANVNAGITVNPGSGFPTLESQWTQFNIDDVSGLGSHTINACCFVASAASNSPLCSGSDLQLTSPTISGASYSWTGPNGYTSSDQNPVILNATTADNGTYTVTVTQTGGCPATMESVVVTVSNPPTATINVSNVTCNGGNDGSLTAVPSGGTAPYTYAWDLNNPTGTSFSVIDDIKDSSHPYDGIGSSFGFVVDGVQGKELTLTRGITYTFNINSPGHPLYITTDAAGGSGSGAGMISNGVNGNFTDVGILTFKPNGSHPALLYYNCDNHSNMGWKINIVNGPGGITASSLSAGGPYTLVITDANGCSSSTSASVTEPAPVPAPTISQNMPACGDIILTSTASAGYMWSTGATTQSIVVSTDGAYSVSAIDGNGCSSAPVVYNAVINPCVPCVTPGLLSTTGITATEASFNWDPVVTGDAFLIRYWKNGDPLPGGFKYTSVTGPNPATSVILGILFPSTVYNAQVKTVCNTGTYSRYSAVHQFTTAAGTIPCVKPFDTRAVNIGTNSATIKWNPIVSADTFKVRYAKASLGAPYNYSYMTVSGTPNIDSIDIASLTPNELYVFSVQTICNGARSRYSNDENFTTLAVPATTPVRLNNQVSANSLGFNVYPNPTSGSTTLEMKSQVSGTYLIRISDISGRVVLTQNGIITKGINQLSLELDALNKGMYLINLEFEDQRVSSRIVLQ